MSFYDPNYRTMPKVPGIHAGTLQPSIGTDHHRMRETERVRIGTAKVRVKPTGGRGDLAMMRPTKPRKRKPMDDRPTGKVRQRKGKPPWYPA